MACIQGCGNPSATVKGLETYCFTCLAGSRAVANPMDSTTMPRTRAQRDRPEIRNLRIRFLLSKERAPWGELLRVSADGRRELRATAEILPLITFVMQTCQRVRSYNGSSVELVQV